MVVERRSVQEHHGRRAFDALHPVLDTRVRSLELVLFRHFVHSLSLGFPSRATTLSDGLTIPSNGLVPEPGGAEGGVTAAPGLAESYPVTGDLPLLGFGLPVAGSWATPDTMRRVARRAEELGYASLWTFQRVLYRVDGELDPLHRSVHDSVVALAHVAGHTDRIGLGTATLCAPFTAPAMLAKTMASLDVLSGGRLTVGLGSGWLPQEYAAAGVPFQRRGARMEEYLRCLQALWTQDPVEFDGEFYTVPRSHLGPLPVQRPHPPVLLGGTAAPALRRAGPARPGLDRQQSATTSPRSAPTSRRCATERARPGATRRPCGSSCAASSTSSTTTSATGGCHCGGTREQVLDDPAHCAPRRPRGLLRPQPLAQGRLPRRRHQRRAGLRGARARDLRARLSTWQGAEVLHSFAYSRVAVLVRHWFEIGLTNGVLEHGARLELRLLEPQAHRGTESAAQRFVIDRPVWRADFDRLDLQAGTFSAAHLHPRFDGDEPSDRVFREELTADPWAWAAAQLSDLKAVADAAGSSPDAVADDARDVREQATLIVERPARSLPPVPLPGECFRLTRDVADTVRIMVDNLADPALVDRAAVRLWLDEPDRPQSRPVTQRGRLLLSGTEYPIQHDDEGDHRNGNGGGEHCREHDADDNGDRADDGDKRRRHDGRPARRLPLAPVRGDATGFGDGGSHGFSLSSCRGVAPGELHRRSAALPAPSGDQPA